MAQKDKMPVVITGVDGEIGTAIATTAVKDSWEVEPFSYGETDKWQKIGKKDIRIWKDIHFFTDLLKRDDYLVVECRKDRAFEAIEHFALEAGKPLVLTGPFTLGEMEAITEVVNVTHGRKLLVLTTCQEFPTEKVPFKVVHEILPAIVRLHRAGAQGLYRLDLFD